MRFITLACLTFACAVPAQVSYFSASLSGSAQVPANATTGGGFGIVRLEEPANTVRAFAHYFGLTGAPTVAHLHLAPAGSNGGVMLPLAAGAAPNTLSATGSLSAAEVTALKSEGVYFNVHTGAFPGGEIRGQVVTSTSTRFQATLEGGQEVPPNASTATGRADAYLHLPDNRLVYCVETNGLANVTAAHLHGAPIGSNGGVIFPLNGAAGTYCGVSPRLTDAQVATLLADGTYFNVHTTAFPGGEIRGQLIKDLETNWVAELDGAQAGTASAGLGSASLKIGKDGVASIVLSFGGLTGTPTVCHIHNAPVGVNGPVVVPLTASGGKFVATFTPTATNLAQVRAGDWYVNLHSTTTPSGEIRGQLLPALLPATFGPNCTGSGGRPEIGATGFAGAGASVSVDLYGAAATTGAFLSLGFNRDTGALSALPLELTTVGVNAPGCFLLLSPVGNVLTFTNPNGCAKLTLSLGFVPTLRGLPIYGQWIILDGPANPAGLVTSNGLTMLFQ